ncbi:MAG: helix-turn-helix domain-containing protein [Victivallales bacterium]
MDNFYTRSSILSEADEILKIHRMIPQPATHIHSHEFHELVLITKGKGIHFTKEERYPIRAGDMFIIWPGQMHGYAQTEGLELINIIYLPELLKLPDFDLKYQPGNYAFFELEPRLRHEHEFKSRLRLSEAELLEAEDIIWKIENELKEKKSAFHYMAAAFFMIFRGMIARWYSGQKSPQSKKLLEFASLMNFISRNLEKDLSVDMLSAKANMSVSTLNRTFRKAFGHSPMEYVIRKRIARACELLSSSNMSVSEIASASGFADSNFFSRQFRKVKGVSPREFRKSEA